MPYPSIVPVFFHKSDMLQNSVISVQAPFAFQDAPLLTWVYVTVAGPAKCHRMCCRNHLFNFIDASFQ